MKVETTIKIKFKDGKTDIELTKEQAEALYNELANALNKSQVLWPVRFNDTRLDPYQVTNYTMESKSIEI